MAALSSSRQNGILLVVLLFAQLLLLSGSSRGADGSTKLESWVMHVTSPVLGIADAVAGSVGRVTTSIGELFAAHAHNRAMEAELERLRTEVESQREAARENLRLRRLLQMRENLVPRAIGAAVVHAVHTDQMKMILVDRGKRDGVREDLPVVAWGGAVGRVVVANDNHAKVRLLSDPSSGVGGVVQRSRAHGVALGGSEGRESLNLGYVPRFADVTVGDRVVTSGLDGVFPRGFGIGEVISVHERPDGTRDVELRPEVDYPALEEVLILLEPVGSDLLAPPGDREER